MAIAAPNESNGAHLVEIARAHVRKYGHARTTVVGVAADAGMTHANVYRFFPSKTALLDEVVASGLRPLEARLREAADGADPAHDKLERILTAIHRDYRGKLDGDPALFDLLITWIFVPSSATVPIFRTPISRASSSTRTNSASISWRKRRLNVAIVSWSG